MQYNTEITNSDALPIPYMEVFGHGEKQRTTVKQLFGKEKRYMQANLVNINEEGQVVVQQIGHGPRLVFNPQRGLEIRNVDAPMPASDNPTEENIVLTKK